MPISELVALVALLLSIIGLTVSLLTYFRDRPRVRAWAEVIWHHRGEHQDDLVPMLRVRIVNLGRRPIALLNLALWGQGQRWSHFLKEPELPDQQLPQREITKFFDRYALAQNSAIRLPEGDILDLAFWPDDCPTFIFTHHDPMAEAETHVCGGLRGRALSSQE